MSLRIKKGDKVIVLAGRDKGKTGKVLSIFPARERALVEGVQMVKKHLRRSQQNPQGAIVSREAPIHLSNLSLVDPGKNKATRFKTVVADDKTKQRVTAKNETVIA